MGRFVYVTYIRTTPGKLWDALTKPEFTKRYWYGTWHDCSWQAGAAWRLMIPDGRIGDAGEILEIDPPRKLVLTWRSEFLPELREEGFSRATFTLEPLGDAVKLTVVHEIDKPHSKFIEAVAKRLASHSFEPEKPCQNRRIARTNAGMAEGAMTSALMTPATPAPTRLRRAPAALRSSRASENPRRRSSRLLAGAR